MEIEHMLNSFQEWKDNQVEVERGGKIMYDVKGYYKYLDDSELFNYYFIFVYSSLRLK